MSAGIKSFVSEKQLDEKRKKRQEEWEQVRKPEDPVEAPEEVYDNRSLYERLQEQKDKKQEDFEEKLKFKNQFRGIDEGESEFLVEVSKRSYELQKQKRDEEAKELEEFRNSVIEAKALADPGTTVEGTSESSSVPKKTQITKKNPQQSILKSAIKRKAQSTSEDKEVKETAANVPKSARPNATTVPKRTIIYPSVTKCVGILPGLAVYDDDSGDTDDDDGSSSDECEMSHDLLSQIVSKSP